MQVAMRFVGNYAPRGLSPQTDGMPVILIFSVGKIKNSLPTLFFILYRHVHTNLKEAYDFYRNFLLSNSKNDAAILEYILNTRIDKRPMC